MSFYSLREHKIITIMKLILSLLLSVIGYHSVSAMTSYDTKHFIESEIFDFSKDLINERLEIISDEIPFKYHPDMERFLKSYTTTGIREAQALIGRKDLYFPIIEHYLWKNGLPESLKYVTMVESKLRPTAVSRAGAVGLWQFMSPTALDYGLKINRYVDERKDPIKATEAAVSYLSDLYEEYEDWLLALAAYNCGPSKVNRAIRSARSRDFWKIRRYLPRQTQKYIPAILAAGYISNYYDYHNIEPLVPTHALEKIEAVTIYERLSFEEIAERTNLSPSLLYKLNPSYRKGFIPESRKGNYLVLPISVVDDFERALPISAHVIEKRKKATYRLEDNAEESVVVPPPYVQKEIPYDHSMGEHMIRSTYTVLATDNIYSLARLFKCDVRQIQRWNQLPTDEVFAGQQLVLYFPKETVK